MKTAPRKFALILGLAFAGLFATQEAQAGTKEILAIASKLAGAPQTDVTAAKNLISGATTVNLSNAVTAAIGDAANIKLLPAVLVAEALKGAGSNAANIGTQLAQDILTHNADTNGTYPKIFADLKSLQTFVGTTASNTATGTAQKPGGVAANPKSGFGANPTQIPTFAAEFITRAGVVNFNAEALLIAEFATKSTTAIGAVLGGRTLNADLDTAQERIDLAKQAIADKKLTKASQQIAQYVGDDVVDNAEAATFALAVVKGNNNAASTKDNNSKYMVQVATGTSTSNPSAASGVVNAMFDGVTGNLTVPAANLSIYFKSAVTNSSKLASSVGLIADGEDVQAIAVTLGSRVGLTNTDPATPTKPKIVGIAQSKVSGLAKALVLSLTNRPTIRTTDPTATATQMVRNSRANRIDEIGEIGAYLLNAIRGLPVFQVDSTKNRKDAPTLVIGLLKTIITASAKVFSDAQFALTENVKKSIVKDAVFQAGVADYAAGDIALTLNRLNAQGLINAQIFTAIVAKLQTSSTSIAGKVNGPVVLAALNAGLTNGANGAFQASVIYEDGTIAGNALEGVNNAETDIRSR